MCVGRRPPRAMCVPSSISTPELSAEEIPNRPACWTHARIVGPPVRQRSHARTNVRIETHDHTSNHCYSVLLLLPLPGSLAHVSVLNSCGTRAGRHAARSGYRAMHGLRTAATLLCAVPVHRSALKRPKRPRRNNTPSRRDRSAERS